MAPRPSSRRKKAAEGIRRQRQLRAVAIAAALVAPALAFAAILLLSPAPLNSMAIPDYASRNPQTREAYVFANSSDGWILQYMPCYCGCGAHSGHASNLACFIKPGGAGFDRHGSECDVCVDIALVSKSMYGKGKSLTEIRDAIDTKYDGWTPTNTPMPPA